MPRQAAAARTASPMPRKSIVTRSRDAPGMSNLAPDAVWQGGLKSEVQHPPA
jgi:hypothetical protein